MFRIFNNLITFLNQNCSLIFLGGLSAVIWTDTLQTVIMLFGAIWLCTQGENWYGVVLWGGGGSHHAVWSYLAVYTG